MRNWTLKGFARSKQTLHPFYQSNKWLGQTTNWVRWRANKLSTYIFTLIIINSNLVFCARLVYGEHEINLYKM